MVITTREEFNAYLREYTFVLPSFENYGRVRGLYDYGPIGARVLNNLLSLIRRIFIRENEFKELITSILTLPEVLQNSGHIERFKTQHMYCENCEVLLQEGQTVCPSCKLEPTSQVIKSNLFQTKVYYLRPETTHTMLSNFKELHMENSIQNPTLLCQIGAKAFRDEVSPRSFIMRMKEFQMFESIILGRYDHQNIRRLLKRLIKKVSKVPIMINDDIQEVNCQEDLHTITKGNHSISTYMVLVTYFLRQLNLEFYFEEVSSEDRAHYSSTTWDIYARDIEGKAWEIGGIADRGCFDLEAHIKNHALWEDLVITELSMGIDRLFYVILSQSLEKTSQKLLLPSFLTPYEFAIFPLLDHEDLEDLSKEIYYRHLEDHDIYYSGRYSIGKRYKYADSIGIRYCITIDFESLEDSTVTIRDQVDKSQRRVHIDHLIAEVTQ